jgi:cellulose synthase/poly-beta-1,6-N-acetylglucosamine synthase-like glycosyltransferase
MISIIVPGYNVEDVVGACLESLLDQTLPRASYEVIFVDDASIDNTRQVVAAYDSIRLLTLGENRGQATARNKGLEVARGELVLFTDADCVPASNWVEAMMAPFDLPEIAGTKGIYRTKQEALVAQFAQVEYESRYDMMRRQRYIDFIDTYSAGYRASVLAEVGGFDPRFRIDEDQELSFRLAAAGYKMVFNPKAVVYHRHPATLKRYLERKYDIGYWKAFVLVLHPGKAVADSHTPQRLKLQLPLTGLFGLALVSALIYPPLIWVALLSSLLFLATAWPLIQKAAQRGPKLGLLAPGLILLRALALGLGLVAGFLRAFFRRGEIPSE